VQLNKEGYLKLCLYLEKIYFWQGRIGVVGFVFLFRSQSQFFLSPKLREIELPTTPLEWI